MNVILENKLAVTSLLLILSFFLKTTICYLYKKKYKQKGLDKRYLINNFNNLFNLLVLILFIALWATELQRFAFSIAAFGVAIVLATKEIIQCFIGFLYLTATSPFRAGDWIQTDGITGEVSKIDWAKVVLLEVNKEDYTYTGRTVYLPNSTLMLKSVKNLNFMKRYVNHHFSIYFEADNIQIKPLITHLNDKAMSYCSDFYDVAERYNSLIENRLEVTIAGPEPTIHLSTTDIGTIKISFTLFCPTEKACELEQKLTTDFFNFLFDNKN